MDERNNVNRRQLTFSKLLSFLSASVLICASAYGTLAGGRPNAFSEGQNAFAGVINPANAVWIEDRFDIGGFWLHQKSSLINYDNNRAFRPGKTDLTYRTKNLFTVDFAIHKQFKAKLCSKVFDSSFSLAAYTTPSFIKLRTKEPIPSAGTTPVFLLNRTDVISAVFSFKLGSSHSIGVAIDYFLFSHRRDGFQNSDNPRRSVSPGNVTNRGKDRSSGFGFTIGWRWKITDRLDFGTAWARKSYCGQFRKYRGYEPHHAENYTPQLFGAGFRYLFSNRLAGRLEVLWSNLGNLPGANNNVLPDGSLNLHKRGSDKSPGPGLQDSTFINVGIGYKVNEMLSVGAGFSHRIKLRKSSNFISHTYTLQTIYEALSLGANFNYKKHDVFLSATYGFKNRVTGVLPIEVAGGGRMAGERQIFSLSMSWGYKY